MRVALLLAYDGSDFAGWWRQPGLRTVAGELDAACLRLGEGGAAAVGCSRTDAGVHAFGQVAHVDLQRPWEPSRFAQSLAAQLPADLGLRAVAPVAEGWHAVHDAVAKTYRYRLDAGAIPDPFARQYAWRTPFALRLEALQAAAAPIAGERDWRGFVRRGDAREDLVRHLTAVTWHADADQWIATVTGRGFAYRLVRSLVGAMVAVAQGHVAMDDLHRSLAGDDTPAGHQQAPACGLYLHDVQYAPAPGWRTAGRAVDPPAPSVS